MVRLLSLLLTLWLTGCSSIPVETDFNPNAPFNEYQRYQWQTETSGSDSSVSPFHAQRVREQLDSLLTGELYREAEQDTKPDFLIRYYVGEAVENYGRGDNSRGSVGLGSGGGNFGVGVSVGFPLGGGQPDRQLRIIIDVIDGQTKQLSWRGSAMVDAAHAPGKVAEDIERAVESIWEKYPPKP